MSKKPKKVDRCFAHNKPIIYTNDIFYIKNNRYCKDCLDEAFKHIKKMAETLDIDFKKPK